MEEARLFRHQIVLCARIRNVVGDKRRQCPLRENEGCQINPTFRVNYSRVGSKSEGGEPSEGMVETRRETLWALGSRREARSRSTGRRLGGFIERRQKIASRGSPCALIDRKPAGATGSELFLPDDRSESSARRRQSNRATLTGGCRVTTGSTGSVGSACCADTWKSEEGIRGHA